METSTQRTGLHTSAAARKRVRKRYRAQSRLKLAGITAIVFAALALFSLLYSVLSRAFPAMSETYITLDIDIAKKVVDPDGKGDHDTLYAANYAKLIKKALKKKFPVRGRSNRKQLYKLPSDVASFELRDHIVKNPQLIGKTITFDLLADDNVDLFVKKVHGVRRPLKAQGLVHPEGGTERGDDITVKVQSNALYTALQAVKQSLAEHAGVIERQALNQKRAAASLVDKIAAASNEQQRGKLQARQKSYNDRYAHLMKQVVDLRRRANQSGGNEALGPDLPTVFLRLNGGVIKATEISPDVISGKVVLPLDDLKDADTGKWQLVLTPTPEENRKITDNQIIWLGKLEEEKRVKRTFPWHFFTGADASEPEEAGILGGLLGTFWTMLVTFVLSVPIGVMGALYLEEFAPKNAITYFIEVSINNLAAIPSIIFGLLGLAVFVNFFGLPYSSSLVGGIVLSLMTLPTVIIASRAAIKAVPPSIREAALGIGASRMQTVFHHVLPLAMPGIMTGSILGMAQALGETAPLLMIGMVAFIVDPPTAVTDAASSLPVLVYLWADRAEVAFDMRTAAAIVLLLAFLVIMNGLAILLRKRFERRW